MAPSAPLLALLMLITHLLLWTAVADGQAPSKLEESTLRSSDEMINSSTMEATTKMTVRFGGVGRPKDTQAPRSATRRSPLPIRVPESKVLVLDRSHLHYVDNKDDEDGVIYTAAGDAVFANSTRPAGRFVLTAVPSRQLRHFTQAQVDRGDVAFKPTPELELGLSRSRARMPFSVADRSGNVLPKQELRIILEPEDNSPPQVIVSRLENARPGGTATVGPDSLDVRDVDTTEAKLQFTVTRPPRAGVLLLDGQVLPVGASFSKIHVLAHRVAYSHRPELPGAAALTADIVPLEVTDGVNTVAAQLDVAIDLLHNQGYSLQVMSPRSGLVVEEGGSVLVDSQALQVSDAAAPTLTFLVEHRPKHGELHLAGTQGVADRWTLAQVETGLLSYHHTGGEVGLQSQNDDFVVSASDLPYANLIQVNVSVTPIDNSPSTVEVIPPGLRVPEGGRVAITQSNIVVRDQDTSPEDLHCSIVAQPLFGVLENDEGPVSSFLYTAMILGSVSYVQTDHIDKEPREDGFSLRCGDRHATGEYVVPVSISPVNDETPYMAPKELVVMEGLVSVLDARVLNVSDFDDPPDLLTFKVLTPPKHGKLLRHAGDQETDTFTSEELTDVVYAHDDSETGEDSFVLWLSDGRHNVTAEVMVMIIPRDDEPPQVAVNNGADVSVGGSVIITNKQLCAVDLDSDDSSLTFIVRQPPSKGYISIVDDINEKLLSGSNFTQEQVNFGTLMYVHTGNTVDLGERDLITFDVTDGFNALLGFDFYITVISDNLHNKVVSKVLELEEGVTAILSTSILINDDIKTENSNISFNVTRDPGHGWLENSDNPSVTLAQFTVFDLESSKIRYVHVPNDNSTGVDSFILDVLNSDGLVLQTIRILIIQKPQIPNTLRVRDLVVPEGGERLLTPEELQAGSLTAPADSLMVKIERQPIHGHLLLHGSDPVSSFSLSDVLNNAVSYRHDGSEADSDSFALSLANGTGDMQTMHVRVVPVDDISPEVKVNKPGVSLEELRYPPALQGLLGLRIDSDMLRAEDADSPTVGLRFHITSAPLTGNILSGSGIIRQNFTQGDLDRGDVYYVLRDSDFKHTADSFQFLVRDPGDNESPVKTFHLQWCWVSLESELYTVEEPKDHLTVHILRRGFLGETSFVSIFIDERTAVVGEDFEESPWHQIQFNPGQSRASWKIYLLDDNIFEREEELAIGLGEPLMASLGHPTTATITIRDLEDESTVFIPKSVYEMEEDSNEVLVEIERTGDLSEEMSVVCITEDGTAIGLGSSNSDFVPRLQYNNTITFSKGQSHKICHIQIIDDPFLEDKEEFTVHLTHPSGGRIGSHNLAKIFILSDRNDIPKVFFGERQYFVDEDEENLFVTVWRAGTDLSNSASALVRSKPLQPLAAKEGYDHLAVSDTIKFNPYEEAIEYKLKIIDDYGYPILEGAETFTLTLHPLSNVILGEPNEIMITINDSWSDLPRINFLEDFYRVQENITEIHIPLLKTGDLSHITMVRCIAIAGNATEDDYHVPESYITFLPGQHQAECIVRLKDDTIYEGEEYFYLMLDNENKENSTSVKIGPLNATKIIVMDQDDETIIRFERTHMSVYEPDKTGGKNTAIIPIIREGDISIPSVVHVYTKDGSGNSGLDYIGKSVALEFKPNEKDTFFVVEILYDAIKESSETVLVYLKPDQRRRVKLKDRKMILFIQDTGVATDVTFPVQPIVVSLRDYDKADVASSELIGGYPIVCITACNTKHPDFKKIETFCQKEGIYNSNTEYRWQMSRKVDKDGNYGEMRDITASMFFMRTNTSVLDSIYFNAGSHVRCGVRVVNANGERGLEFFSRSVTISTANGLCLPETPTSLVAEPFTAKLKYTGVNDNLWPNLVRLTVTIPHRDGMLPIISTKPLNNFNLILERFGIRVKNHKCSNLLDYFEVDTKHGFITNSTKSNYFMSEIEPYQYSSEMRGEETLRFYKNLNLEACVWQFESYYEISELVSHCGGLIDVSGQSRSLIQSSVTIQIPLYISYLFYSPMSQEGWLHNDLHTMLRLVFVYDTAVMWQQGIEPPKGSQLDGQLYPTSMRIENNGSLVVNFRTVAKFRGIFVLSHPQTSNVATVTSNEHTDLSFVLSLMKSEPTLSQSEQEWEFVSDYAVQDYSGTYIIRLIPCVVWEDVPYTNTFACSPQDPISFELKVRFQQVSDPVPEEFTLDTQFILGKQKQVWLSNSTENFEKSWDSTFQPGERIFGRIVVDPMHNMGNTFYLNIDKCFVCSGVNGYIPKYNPLENEFGCLVQSPKLVHSFKIIDKSFPNSAVKDYKKIEFDVNLIEDYDNFFRDEPYETGSDSFSFRPDPLFQVSQGRQWFVHCIYTIKSYDNKRGKFVKRDSLISYNQISRDNTEFQKRLKRELQDTQGIGIGGMGTNLHEIELAEFTQQQDSFKENFMKHSFRDVWWISVTSAAMTIMFAAIMLLLVWYKNKSAYQVVVNRIVNDENVLRTNNVLTKVDNSCSKKMELQLSKHRTVTIIESTDV